MHKGNMAYNPPFLTHSSQTTLGNIKYMSQEELQTHNKRDDLWISIQGKIYNVTNWINHHPGGKLSLRYFAGQEVTDVFLAYHRKATSKYLDKYFTGYYLENYRVSELSKDYRKLMSHFQNMGLFEQKGHSMSIFMLITLTAFLGSVFGVLYSENLYVHIASAFLMGFSWIECGWIMHDSNHYTTMMNPKLNQLALLLVSNCAAGISADGFKTLHDAHHISTNALEYDPDTHFLPVLVNSPDYLTTLSSKFYNKKLHSDPLFKFLVSYQNVTYFLFLAFGRFFGYFQSLHYVLFHYKRKKANMGKELIGIIVFWIWYSLLLQSLPNWFERVTFFVVALNVAGIQTFQFALNHTSCDAYAGAPSGDDWVAKQIVGTLDIECSPYMDWFHGGLQFQIEHHLFPKLPRSQLRRISPVVKELCKKHNLPYCAKSFWEVCGLTLETIRGVAQQARESAYYPIART